MKHTIIKITPIIISLAYFVDNIWALIISLIWFSSNPKYQYIEISNNGKFNIIIKDYTTHSIIQIGFISTELSLAVITLILFLAQSKYCFMFFYCITFLVSIGTISMHGIIVHITSTQICFRNFQSKFPNNCFTAHENNISILPFSIFIHFFMALYFWIFVHAVSQGDQEATSSSNEEYVVYPNNEIQMDHYYQQPLHDYQPEIILSK